MHMQDGVGRQGYRMLAGVIAGVGLIGLISAVYAFRPSGDLFHWLGIGLVAAALAGLLGVAFVVLRQAESRSGATVAAVAPRRARAAVEETPAQAIEVQRMRTIGHPLPPSNKPLPRPAKATQAADADGTLEPGIEYRDVRAAARAAPTELVLPRAFQDEPVPGAVAARDPKAWPERRAPRADPIRPGEMALRAARTLEGGPATIMAKVWYPQSGVPRGWGKGRCGDCGTQLLAPPERPIHLRCPHCDKITAIGPAAATA